MRVINLNISALLIVFLATVTLRLTSAENIDPRLTEESLTSIENDVLYIARKKSDENFYMLIKKYAKFSDILKLVESEPESAINKMIDKKYFGIAFCMAYARETKNPKDFPRLLLKIQWALNDSDSEAPVWMEVFINAVNQCSSENKLLLLREITLLSGDKKELNAFVIISALDKDELSQLITFDTIYKSSLAIKAALIESGIKMGSFKKDNVIIQTMLNELAGTSPMADILFIQNSSDEVAVNKLGRKILKEHKNDLFEIISVVSANKEMLKFVEFEGSDLTPSDIDLIKKTGESKK